MKIMVCREGGNIITVKDYSDIESKGEIAQMITELELIKLDLLDLYEEYSEEHG